MGLLDNNLPRGLEGRFRLCRVLVAGVAGLALFACSVSTPRDGVIQGAPGLPSSQGGSAGTGEAGQLGVGQGVTGADGAPAGTVPAGATAPGDTRAGAGGGQVRPGQAGPTGSPAAGGAAPRPAAPGASGPVPGVTAKEIRFSVLAGFSGLYGQVMHDVVNKGFGTWVEDVNARGGINGRRVVLIKVDNKDTVEGGVAACKQVEGNNSYFAFSLFAFGGADVSASNCLDRAAIPTITYFLTAYNNRWKSVYTITETGVASRPLASFIKNVLKLGNTKIGLFVERDPVSTSSKQPFLDGMAKLGMKVVHTETIASTQGSYVSEVSRMKASGAETVVMLVAAVAALGIPRDARAVGYNPTFTGAIFATDEFSSGSSGPQGGMQVLRHYATVDSPAYPKFVQTAKKYGNENVTATTMSVYGLGLVLEEVLRNAGGSPTREGFGSAVEQVVNYDNGIVAISFGKGNHRATGRQYPIKCCHRDNAWMSLGPPRTDF